MSTRGEDVSGIVVRKIADFAMLVALCQKKNIFRSRVLLKQSKDGSQAVSPMIICAGWRLWFWLEYAGKRYWLGYHFKK